jgi:hypothetical protein
MDKFMVHRKKGEGERERIIIHVIIIIRNGAKTISLPNTIYFSKLLINI